MPTGTNGQEERQYIYCSEVKIIIVDGDNNCEVQALRYRGMADGSDLIIFEYPGDLPEPPVDQRQWGSKIRIEDEEGVKPAVCDIIDQPLTAPGELVRSRVRDWSEPNFGSKLISCPHITRHVAPGDTQKCREALGTELCTQLPHKVP